jgi:hypothetical protein
VPAELYGLSELDDNMSRGANTGFRFEFWTIPPPILSSTR